MSYIVIDEHGEIREEFIGKTVVGLNAGDRVVRKASIDNYKKYCKKKEEDQFEYINSVSEIFAKVDVKELKCILNELDVFERGFLLSVVPYVGYDSSLKKSNGRAVLMKDLVKISGISQRKLYDILKELTSYYIICKKNDVFYINPWLISKGDKLSKDLKDMFGEYRVRCKHMKRWADL